LIDAFGEGARVPILELRKYSDQEINEVAWQDMHIRSTDAWIIPAGSEKFITFIHTKPDGTGVDDDGTCWFQALRHAGRATIMAKLGLVDAYSCDVDILSDQIT
jgi:hypothetical protein